MDTLTRSIKAKLYANHYNPFSWVFAVVWLIWNYRFLLVLVSSLPIEEKFEYIDLELFPTVELLLTQSLLFPLATTVVIVLLYPYPARFFYRLNLYHQAKMRRAKQSFEEQQLLSREDSKNILDLLSTLKNEYSSNSEYTSAQIQGLTTQIELLKSQLAQSKQNSTTEQRTDGQGFYNAEQDNIINTTEHQEAIFDKADTKNIIQLQDSVKNALSHSRWTVDELLLRFNEVEAKEQYSSKENEQHQFIKNFLSNFFCCEQKLCEVLISFLDLKMKYGDDDQLLDAEVQLQLTPKINKFNKYIAEYHAELDQFKKMTSFEVRSTVEDYFSHLIVFKDVDKDFNTLTFTQNFAHLRRIRKTLLKQGGKLTEKP